MKTFFTLVLVSWSISVFSQGTPCLAPPPHGSVNAISLQKTFGDTITLEEYGSGTVITNQYLPQGAIFSGLPSGMYCDTYDYGETTYGKILKSSSWYDIVKLEFVEPADASVPKPVKHFGYENPVDSEIDYVVTNFYDENDQLVYTYTSTSPEVIDIDLGDTPATYVTFDDEQSTAYVLDNIWFIADSTVVESVTESGSVEVGISPNPFIDQTTFLFSTPLENVTFQLFDTNGKLVFNETNISGIQYILNRGNLHSGLYCYRISKNAIKLQAGNVRVR